MLYYRHYHFLYTFSTIKISCTSSARNFTLKLGFPRPTCPRTTAEFFSMTQKPRLGLKIARLTTFNSIFCCASILFLKNDDKTFSHTHHQTIPCKIIKFKMEHTKNNPSSTQYLNSFSVYYARIQLFQQYNIILMNLRGRSDHGY